MTTILVVVEDPDLAIIDSVMGKRTEGCHAREAASRRSHVG